MKNKNIIIIASVLIAGLLVWLFWPEIKAMLSKKEDSGQQDENNTNQVNTQGNTPLPVVIKPISIGDTVIANKDLVKAFDINLNAVVRTYNNGNYVGTVKKDQNGWLTVQDTGGATKKIQKINVKRLYA